MVNRRRLEEILAFYYFLTYKQNENASQEAQGRDLRKEQWLQVDGLPNTQDDCMLGT